MAILKYAYLSLGIILFVFLNILSYTHEAYAGELNLKILFSFISFSLLMFDYAAILFTKKLFKREFDHFTLYVKITLYLGIIVAPMISLYY
ncbi:MAG: hypothetical protein RBT45_06985 [Acholeplasmataceae bacterium]|jgi:hypothetical protein|nr:hypothetical protein [Acholeplasmataceae bacterium]